MPENTERLAELLRSAERAKAPQEVAAVARALQDLAPELSGQEEILSADRVIEAATDANARHRRILVGAKPEST